MKQIACVKTGRLNDPDLSARGEVDVIDVPEPEVGDEDVKIKVAYCAICGSDPHLVEGVFGLEPPFGLGHEVSGVIVELGKNATKKGLKVGDKVAGNFIKKCGTCYYCRNGQEQFCEYEVKPPAMSEYIVWHESQVEKVPEGMDLRHACMMEPVSIIVRIIDKSQAKIGQRVLVSGGGPIGLLTLQAFKMFGATDLTLSEPIEERRELAMRFGADHTIDPLSQDFISECDRITDGKGFDIVIEASGNTRAAQDMCKIAAKCGTVLFVAMYPLGYEMPFNLQEYCFFKELTVSAMNVAPYAYPRTAAVLGRFDLDPFVNKVFPIDQAKEAFEAQMSGKYPKILIKCNEDLD